MAETTLAKIDFGPLQAFVDDTSVHRIMVNGVDQIYVERSGKMEKIEKVQTAFRDNAHIVELINALLAPFDLQVSADYPYANARFPDGTRLQAFIPPIAVSGPSLTIRKPPVHRLTFEDYLDFGAMSAEMAAFLRAGVEARLNILVSGSVGGGKTTLLNILASAIPAGERIVTVEEEAELRLQQGHVITLESRPPDREGKGEIGVKDLLRMLPRARPDRILIGELGGPEVLDALRLVDKGHNGTLTSISAHSPQEALERLEMMVKMNDPNLPVSYLRSLIGAVVDLIVQQNRLEDGSRKIVRVSEVLTLAGGDYELRDVFVFQRTGVEKGRVVGLFEGHPVSPGLLQRLKAGGVREAQLPQSVFAPPDDVEREAGPR